jgi:hypothetical protein
MSTTATANQLGFLASLIRERARQLKITDVDAAVTALREQRITFDGASAMIDRLTAMKKDPPVAKAGAVRSQPANSYAGRCVLCGGNVAVGEGTYRRGGRGWETLHLPGQCPEKAASKQTFAERVTELLDGLPDGFYAVPAVAGTNDLTFVSFATNKGVFNPAKKGERYVRHIIGGNNDAENVSIAWVEKVAAAVRHAGTEASAILYGQRMGQCGFCGKSLTRRYSAGMGYGPTCSTKHGLPFDFAAYAASQLVEGAGSDGE